MFKPKKRLTLLEWSKIERKNLEATFLTNVLSLEEVYMLKIKANKELPFSFYKIKRIFLD
jgi:hypothetical protein